MSVQFKFNQTNLRVSSIEAKSMVKAYHCHPKKLRTESGDTLKGLIVDKADLLAILGLQDDALPSSPQKYCILFAISLDDVEKPTIRQDFTAIMAPIVNHQIDMSNLRNVFDPCPTLCDEISNYDDEFDSSMLNC